MLESRELGSQWGHSVGNWDHKGLESMELGSQGVRE